MLSYKWVPVIGICPLLPALHAGSVNIDMMPDYSNSCFKEWVHGVCGWDAFISHVCFRVVQVFLLQFFPASSLFGCLTAVHYWWLNLLWIIFCQRIEVVFPTVLERSSRYTSGCYFPSCRSSRFWFGGLIGGSAGREPGFLRCFVRLGDRKWIFVFATLGSHVKAWKATAHHGRICCAAYPKVGTLFQVPLHLPPWASTLNCQQVLNELFCAEKPDIMFISETWQHQSHRTTDCSFLCAPRS